MKCVGRCSRFTVYLSLSLFCLALCSVANAQTCASDTPANIDNGDEGLNSSLNEYAIIFKDADPRNPGCNQRAATHLETKLTNTFTKDYPDSGQTYSIDQLNALNPGTFPHHPAAFGSAGPFQGWLEGGFPTYIFPTALRLYTEGKVNANLEKLLDKAAEFMASNAGQDANGGFVLRSKAPDCNLNKSGDFGNNCMDDYSIAAAGFAWAAAYKTFRQKVNLPDLVGPANSAIAASFSTDSSICIVPDAVARSRDAQKMPASGRGPCTGTAQDLRAAPPPQTGISVVAGTYGGNCGASHGNVTGALASACNSTLGHCDYIVDYTIIGDPAPGCAKDYVAEWTCNGQSLVQQATASPEAGFRKPVILSCLPAQTFSLNHGHQTPAYGYGLLTSISSAAFGLKMAGASHIFSADEKTIALALLAEANRLTRPSGQQLPSDYLFANRPTLNDPEACLKVVAVGAASFADAPQFQITAPINIIPNSNPPQPAGGDCADLGAEFGSGYKPRMYALGDFFSDPNVIGAGSTNPLPLGFGGSALFPDPLVNNDGSAGFFSVGREVYSGSLGWDARNSLLIPISPLPPLPPNPVYPSDGTLHAPSSFTLRWNDGLDSSRRSLQWPVTYAIYYKAWNYGATEPASYFFFGSGFQCNADSSGTCTLPVSNVAAGNYRWYVVANMDVSISTGVPNSIESTQSSTAYFTAGYQPISTIPAPLPPNPIYPGDGTLHVASNFTLRWNDGLDASRRSPFWPVTYAIYYKAWNYGTAEPNFYYFFGSGFQCNADFTGACTLPVSNVARGNYRWYVVANMDVSASTGVANSVLSTQGAVAFFTIGYDASVSIAWIQPSARSWGPANTLTAAGFASGGVGGVTLQWRDATLNGPWNTVAYQAPPDPSNGGWSNTIPSADNCHAFQATAQYSGVSASFNYDGVAQGYCSFRVIWIQPQSSAGFGPPGSLVVAGSAQGGPTNAQVTLWFRDDTAQSGWMPLDFAPIPDSTGTWYNSIQNVDYTHQYSVYIVYDNRSSGTCSYFGNGSATTCP